MFLGKWTQVFKGENVNLLPNNPTKKVCVGYRHIQREWEHVWQNVNWVI